MEHIRKAYFGKIILRDVHFQLDRGERLALIGANGSGKTSLLRIIAGEEEADRDGGNVTLARGTVLAYLQQELGQDSDSRYALSDPEFVSLQQAIRSCESRMAKEPRNRDLLSEYSRLSARFESLGGWDFQHRLAATLAGLGLSSDAMDRPLHTFSGGERMRVALAGILIRQPDLLLLDEPTNHLDVEACEWLENYLAAFSGTLIVVSHDRRFLDNTATITAELKNGSLTMRRGNYSSFKQQEAELLFHLQKEEKKLSLAVKHESEVAQTMLSHRKMTSYHSREKKVQKLSEALRQVREKTKSERKPFHLKIQADEDRGDPTRVLIRTENLGILFPDADESLFKPLNLLLKGREKICICGPNGCGKSNLIRALAGRNPYVTGTVSLASNLRIAFLDQWVRFSDPETTVIETLMSGNDNLSENMAREDLASYGFFDTDLQKKISVLSGGEKARLALACLLQENPDILFLDEPTNHLDIESREILEKAIRKYRGTVLAVSHDRYFIDQVADKIWGFLQGQIREFQAYSHYRSAEKQSREQNRLHPAGQNPAMTDKSESLLSAPPSVEQETLFWSEQELALMPVLKEMTKRSRNKVSERKFRALAAECMRKIEDRAADTENKIKETESQFGSNDSAQLYHEYAALRAELEELYALYEKIGLLIE